MANHTITLYVNDPMGKRWQQNLETARKAGKECGAEVILVSKTSREYASESDPPPCPSVAVNKIIVLRDGVIVYEDLKAELLRAG